MLAQTQIKTEMYHGYSRNFSVFGTLCKSRMSRELLRRVTDNRVESESALRKRVLSTCRRVRSGWSLRTLCCPTTIPLLLPG